VKGQFAGPRVLVGIPERQRQAKGGRGGRQRIRIGVGHQPGVMPALREADTQFGPDAGRLAWNQGQPGLHRRQGAAVAASRLST
jgi:hypothetical protein